jgi:hypothetical protein
MRVSLRGLYPQYTFFSGRDIGARQGDDGRQAQGRFGPGQGPKAWLTGSWCATIRCGHNFLSSVGYVRHRLGQVWNEYERSNSKRSWRNGSDGNFDGNGQSVELETPETENPAL